MTAKEYLSQTLTLNKRVKKAERRLQELRREQLREDYIPAGFPNLVYEYLCDMKSLLGKEKEIEAVIDNVEFGNLRIVLYERYINLKSWHKIAADNGYDSSSTVHRHHKMALEWLDKSAWDNVQ